MTNNKSGLNELDDRIYRIISKMSKTAKLKLLKQLENLEESKITERRDHLRRRVYGIVGISDQKELFTASISSLSTEGLFIETKHPFFTNQNITLTLLLPGHKDPVKINGKITRIDSQGIGVKFNEPLIGA